MEPEQPVPPPRLSVVTPGLVGRQSAVYLGVIYLIYTPRYAYFIMSVMFDTKLFGAALAKDILSASTGLWFAIVYWYFSFCGSTSSGIVSRIRKRLSKDKMAKNRKGRRCGGNGNNKNETTIMDSGCFRASGQLSQLSNFHNEVVGDGDDNIINKTSSDAESASSGGRRYSFNIFDGKKPAGSSAFSEFVFDGDEEDLENDEAESRLWESCQIINSTRHLSEQTVQGDLPAGPP